MSTITSIDRRRYGRLLSKALPRVIQSEDEHEHMVAEVGGLIDKGDSRNSEEDALLELMTVLIQDYEERHHPVPEAEPEELLRYLMRERGLKPSDLWPVVGSKSRVSEILSGKRSISREQAKRLAAFFRVPLELFI